MSGFSRTSPNGVKLVSPYTILILTDVGFKFGREEFRALICLKASALPKKF